MKIISQRFLNFVLRGFTVFVKFLFILVLMNYLEPGDIGQYGLFVAAVGISSYIIGFDFYTYSTREIAINSKKLAGKYIKNHTIFIFLLYLIITPFIIFILFFIFEWPKLFLIFYIIILIIEHISTEIYRFLVVMSEQLYASLIIFIKQGAWAILATVFMVLDDSYQNLNTVFVLWGIGVIFACLLGIWKVKNLPLGGWRSSTDWKWITRGIRVGFIFLISTLAIRGIQTVDRYTIEMLGDTELVGSYVIIIGIAGTLPIFLEVSIFSYMYPKILEYAKDRNNGPLIIKLINRSFVETLIVSVLFGLSTWILLPILFKWIGNPVYSDVLWLYPWLLLAIFVSGLATIPHYGLYSYRKDYIITLINSLGFIIFVSSIFFLKNLGTIECVVFSLNISYFFIFIFKFTLYKKFIK